MWRRFIRLLTAQLGVQRTAHGRTPLIGLQYLQLYTVSADTEIDGSLASISQLAPRWAAVREIIAAAGS